MRIQRSNASFLPLVVPSLSLVLAATPSAQDDAPDPAGGTPPVEEEGPPAEPRRGVYVHEAGAFEGYTLLSPLTSKTTFLVDMEGNVVHEWNIGSTESAIFLDNGNLLRWGIVEGDNPRFKGPGVDGGIIEEVTWEGEVLWRLVVDDDDQLLHHDIALLPNGNVLFLVWEHRSREDAIAAGRAPGHVGEEGMWPDAVYEIARPTGASPTPGQPVEGGEIVWEWHVWDHLVQDQDPEKDNFGSVPDEPGRIDVNFDHRDRPPMTLEEIAEQEELERQMAALGYGGGGEEEDDAAPSAGRPGTVPDWMHTNAIDYHPELDLILMSSPNLNEIFVIDHSTTTEEAASDSGGRWGRGGELLWRWGNPRNYGAGDDGHQQLSFQHDPTFLPANAAGELRVLVFDNGRVRPGSDPSTPYSSVDELVLPFDRERGFLRDGREPYGPAGPVWSYSDPGTIYSPFISGTNRLPNGNTLLCSGVQGLVVEVNPSGEVVWAYESPLSGDVEFPVPTNSLYRAVRIAKDHPALAGKL